MMGEVTTKLLRVMLALSEVKSLLCAYDGMERVEQALSAIEDAERSLDDAYYLIDD
nr:MAG TPA: hypothetical protein [Caudoviricetes sp.]